jgi:hypothetical protein
MPPRRFCDCWFAAELVTRLIGVIHEGDSALRTLIDREAGIRDVEEVFDAPTREWASRRTTPTVDGHLYDIREDLRRRERGVLSGYRIGSSPIYRAMMLRMPKEEPGVQGMFVQRQEEEEEQVQGLFVQRAEGEEEEEPVQGLYVQRAEGEEEEETPT